jgi:hypothetical protein
MGRALDRVEALERAGTEMASAGKGRRWKGQVLERAGAKKSRRWKWRMLRYTVITDSSYSVHVV